MEESRNVKRITLLIAAALMLMVSAVPAFAQGNTITCPEGAGSNAAGTRCIDLATGEEVAPVDQVLVNPETPQTSVCPEEWALVNGVCVDPRQPVVDPPPPPEVLPPPPPPAGSAALPATGGVSPVLASLVLASLAVLGSVALIWRR